MSERERWVVYPILFLTLGIALRDKMFQRVATKAVSTETSYADVSVSNKLRANVVECEKIVVSSRGRPVITAGASRNGSGTIQTFGAGGQQLVVIEDNESGGMVTVTDYGQRQSVALGHAGGGVYAGLLIGPARGLLMPWLPWLSLRPTDRVDTDQSKVPPASRSDAKPQGGTPGATATAAPAG